MKIAPHLSTSLFFLAIVGFLDRSAILPEPESFELSLALIEGILTALFATNKKKIVLYPQTAKHTGNCYKPSSNTSHIAFYSLCRKKKCVHKTKKLYTEKNITNLFIKRHTPICISSAHKPF